MLTQVGMMAAMIYGSSYGSFINMVSLALSHGNDRDNKFCGAAMKAANQEKQPGPEFSFRSGY